MTYYTKTLRSIIGGMSEVSDKFMTDGQCRNQVNMVSYPEHGTVKRPSTVLRQCYRFLDSTKEYKWFDFEISGYSYEFILGNDNLYVVRNKELISTLPLTGDIKDYLSVDLDEDTDETTIDLKNIELYYINDKIYMVNKDVTVRAAVEETVDHPVTVSIWATGVSTNKLYSAVVSVHKVSNNATVFTTDAEREITSASDTKGTGVISSLYAGLDTKGPDATGELSGDIEWFTKGINKDVLAIKLKPEYEQDYYLSVETSDDAANTYLKSYADTAKTVLDLPRFGLNGQRAKISSAEGDIDDWYVNFNADKKTSGRTGETVRIKIDWRDKEETRYIDTNTSLTWRMYTYSSKTVNTEITSIKSDLYSIFDEHGNEVGPGSVIRVGKHAETLTLKLRDPETSPVSGVWEECAAPGSNNFEKSTLPIILDQDEEEVWSLTQELWEPRRVGDSESAPFPEFVDKRINSLHERSGRLMVITDDNAPVSTTNEFQNFFRKTATKLQVTDPFPMSAAGAQGNFKTAVNLNGELFIWGDKDQFKLVGSSLQIGESNLSTVSSYTSSSVAPIVTGNVIHFVAESNKYNAIYAYAQERNSQTAYAADSRTLQIPTLLEGKISKIVSDYNMSALLVQMEEKPRTLFIHNFFYENGQMQQNAWAQLNFNFDVLDVFVQDDVFILITKQNDLYMSLEFDLKDLVRPNKTHTDFEQVVQFVDGVADVKYVTDEFVVIDNFENIGDLIEYTLDGSTITCPSLVGKGTVECIIGTQWQSIYTPRLVVENTDSGFIKFNNTITLNKLGLELGLSGEYTVHITRHGTTKSYPFNKMQIPSALSDNNVTSGTKYISTRTKSDQDTTISIESNSHLPFSIEAVFLQYRSSSRGGIKI